MRRFYLLIILLAFAGFAEAAALENVLKVCLLGNISIVDGTKTEE